MQIEIRPGEGGEDAARFADELADALRAYARRRGDSVTRSPGSEHARMVVLEVDGPRAAYLGFSGTHRIQRVPGNDTRRHTSTATVAVLDAGRVERPRVRLEDCRVEAYRSSGNGGQNRNKVASCARVTHLPSGITVEADEQRHFDQNRRAALRRIEERLAAADEAAQSAATRAERRQQVDSPERPAKRWTHCAYRSTVVNEETGERFSSEDFRRGRVAPTAA